MIKRFIDFIDNAENIKKTRKLFYIILILVIFSDFFVHREHAAFFWDKIPGWGALYGFISCVLIIIVSKFIGHQGGVMKDENYYDK
ncbi:MAG: hypothetical protein A3I04_01965 [Nitrospinae bacterium RIFCSPLOWO2_02_FULL_39_110]|nr:MAG: hypothetical protein A2W53_02730 [Nitrospinae bacterium RIFCSPHIGHO2_02_39_11]OGV97750.1 MAG: hypothetical protein A3D97_06280 [Nitrospinae bacterium RIFCSPHIGHO2_12_FULL_39_42]OGW02102.1 MAG: hypothetical protein A2Z59_03590 [Nitrospinae bacterium RIFCSPLOWO2_02_39_17]OGW02343.1 MAG: hypothetical protein A3D20_06065 [Nitrospinae bacterium RIFCSPHIGHO2_02_FULL_39_82]OGW07381.1 MAG: hypothetical protein A3I04_01965 [Nitrospinae bacterium RIFCSPLOWO2_02_FULL_39_110]OGW07903.1 MAG: hypoth